MDAQEIVKKLGLEPLTDEGGYFSESSRTNLKVPGVMPRRSATGGTHAGSIQGERPFSTAIYYLLTPDTFSAIHRLASDEVYHFYLGDPVELVQLLPDGGVTVSTLGTDIAAGMVPQLVVPAGVWQGSRLAAGGRFALLGTTMAPGFSGRDFQLGERAALSARYPEQVERISALTRAPGGDREETNSPPK